MKWILLLLILCSVGVYAIDNSERTIFQDKKAYVNNVKGYLDQEPYMLNKGEIANINFKPNIEVSKYTVCFDFKGEEEKVIINSFKKKNLFVDNNLNQKTKNDKYVCMKQISYEKEIDFSFEAYYLGYGILKYDVYIPELNLTLDPYLVGDLENLVLVHYPFDGNLSDISPLINFEYINNTLISVGNTDEYAIGKSVDNINDYIFKVNISADTAGGVGPQECLFVEFSYTDGTLSNTTRQCLDSSTRTYNYTNPYTSNEVSLINIWSNGTGNSIRSVGIFAQTNTENASYINSSTITNATFGLNTIGEVNSSIYLNGTDQYVVSNFTADGLSAFTISIWANLTNLSVSREILGYYKNSNEQFYLRVRNDGYIDMFLGNGSSSCDTTNDGGTISENTWNNIIVTWNGTVITRYINGDQTGTIDSCILDNIDNDLKSIYVGTRNNDGTPDTTKMVEGFLDELLIFNYALNSSSINLLSNGYTNKNVNFYREETQQIFNISNHNISITAYCTNGSSFIYSVDSSNEAIPNECTLDQWYISVSRGDSNYYRTLIPNLSQSNVSIYLLDLTEDTALQTIFQLNDLANNYDDGSLIAKKSVGTESIEVIRQKFDIASQVTFWLDQSQIYTICIENNDGDEECLGDYIAESAQTKTLTVPSIPLGYVQDFDLAYPLMGGNKTKGEGYLYWIDFTDGGYVSLNWTLFYGNNGSVAATYYNTSQFNTTVVFTGLDKDLSYMSLLVVNHVNDSYDLNLSQPFWLADKTTFEGFTAYDDDIKLFVSVGLPMVTMMLASVTSIYPVMFISIGVISLFERIGWYGEPGGTWEGINQCTMNIPGVAFCLTNVRFIIFFFSIMLALLYWNKVRGEAT